MIPHPLVTGNPKEMDAFFATRKEERESLVQYLHHGKNARWAASHLVRAISQGLSNKEDRDVSMLLNEIANYLAASPGREPPIPAPLPEMQ